MIVVQSNQEYMHTLSNNIDKNTNIVIIGDGETKQLHKKILHFETIEEVRNVFGNSPLANAYETAYKYGCKYIFLINSIMKYDYIDIANTLMQHDFAYIVPININLTDYFINPNTNNKEYYIEYMLDQITEHNHSHIIVTDKHASLYDDIDDYIDYMNNNSNIFYNKINNNKQLTNVSYVANNLYQYDFSNVVLAAQLCSTQLYEYPNMNVGPSVFDIDELDTKNMDFVFFQNNHIGTSIEHLFNLNRESPHRKDVMMDRLIRYIKRNLYFDEYIGKPYNGQQNITIRTKISRFMERLVGQVIQEYRIKNVYFEKERFFVGNIIIELEFRPIGRSEIITILTSS